jgi:sugar/nucleoside kinase (ribokinase family)
MVPLRAENGIELKGKIMGDKQFDVAGIGSAIVDVIARCDDAFIAAKGLNKGAMRLIDADEAAALYAGMGAAVEMSGGSVSNTCAGLASLGGRAVFIGKVARDQLGDIFAHDIRAIGVTYTTAPSHNSAPTGRCLIMVTPDGERTMNTFLGAASELTRPEVDMDAVRASKLLYLEGYSFDHACVLDVFYQAADVAKAAGTQVAVSLSDPFCVDRHRAAFLTFVEAKADIVFANERELLSLYQTEDLDAACARIRGHSHLACITRSAHGSIIVTQETVINIAADPVEEVVDTTGAGDLYAAGFLLGHARGLPLETCGKLASLAAGEIVSHMGPRPQTSLLDMARARGLL